ncbi:MAG: hypothetical protein JOZ19_15885 [Rubrobacter sp.]|nr:hypothetical protein [Rubrobacter sp.]
MFWKRGEGETSGERPEALGPLADHSEDFAAQSLAENIEIERDAPRAASIAYVAEKLGQGGEEVVELFKEVNSPTGRAILPIHLRRDEEDVFVEVETGPWDRKAVRSVLKTAAVLRGSEYSDATLEVLGAYTIPEEVRYFCGRSPAALFQLDLIDHDDLEKPEACAETFRSIAERHWGSNLDYRSEELTLVEDMLLAALGEKPEGGARVPILDVLVHNLGCYVGETLRRHVTLQSSWRSAVDWGEDLTLEFPGAAADPIGKARAFLENGPEDSVAYYVTYALEELND